MGVAAYLISAGLVLAGTCAYWFYGRKHVMRESALLHLVERITARELVAGTLESELKEIIRERDNIVHDRFDHIVEDCMVLDVEGAMDVNEFFDLAARHLADRVGMRPGALAEALKSREAQSNTALSPDLAIPHAVVEGEKKFDVLLARVREGVRFSESAPAVQAVFVLVGSLDERNFYLSALAAVAQAAGSPEFMPRWLKARGPQGLRDVVLLAERARV